MWAACLLAHRIHTARAVAGRAEDPSHEAIVGAILESETMRAIVQLQKDFRQANFD